MGLRLYFNAGITVSRGFEGKAGSEMDRSRLKATVGVKKGSGLHWTSLEQKIMRQFLCNEDL
jgi:hypothetical protein